MRLTALVDVAFNIFV